MLQIYYRILISAWKTFGLGLIFCRWLLLLPLFSLFTHFTLFLDLIFFPQYRKVEIKKPVFIIGHPRSGTTFLHHLLTQAGDYATFNTWHIGLPSLTARFLLKPIINYLIQKDRSTIIPDRVGHKVALNRVEEEEFLFLHKLDTQFVITLSPLAFDDQEYSELRLHDKQPESRRKNSVKFFKGCLQRQIYYTGKHQVVAQIHYSTHRIKTLIEAFPDAKFIYLVRAPYETIPSHFSLNWNLFDYRWGLKNIAPERLKQYYERRYRYNIEIYRYFYELQKKQEITEDNVMVLPYEQLRANLYGAFEKVVAFTEIEISENLCQAIENQVQDQKNYKRKHKVMELDMFGLTKEQIAKDLSFVFEEYGLENHLEQEKVT